MDYGRAIRTARSARGLSQQELARRAKVDASYISLVERGERTPRIDRLESIAAGLELPLSLLIFMGSSKDDLRGMDEKTSDQLGKSLLAFLTDSNSK